MTRATALRCLASDLDRLQEALQSLRFTVEDRPLHAELALVSLQDAVHEKLGCLEEAIKCLALCDSTDAAATFRSLIGSQEIVLRLQSRFSSDLGSHAKWEDLQNFAAEHGREWIPWVNSVKTGIQACWQCLEKTLQSFTLCWQELGEDALIVSALSRSPVAAVSTSAAALEYARRVFENITDWYKNADSKAQILLGLNAGFLAFLTSAVFGKHDEVVSMIKSFKVGTWILLAFMCATLTASIVSALFCLWSRIYREETLKKYFRKLGIETERGETYRPEVMWFFQMIKALGKEPFRNRLLTVTKEFEIHVMASEIFELSKRVAQKHYWINIGFTFAGASLLLFVAAIATYIKGLR